MNKQTERLISEDKVLEWLDDIIIAHIKLGQNERASAYKDVKHRITTGRFSPDPTPLPTLKPWDEVKHEKFPFPGIVDSINELGQTAYCRFGPAPSGRFYETDFPIADLELVKEVQSDVR